MKNLKSFIITMFVALLLFTSCNNTKNDEFKYEYFQNRYENITKISPHDINFKFLEMCLDDNTPFYEYSQEMINRQCAASFRIGSEELVELIVDILIYKKILNNDKEYSLNELKSFINRIQNNSKDKFDKIVVESFELAIDYKTEELKLINK